MKKFIVLLVLPLLVFGCKKEGEESEVPTLRHLPFYHMPLDGVINYPDGKGLPCTLTFRKDLKFEIVVDTKSVEYGEWRLKKIEGTYSQKELEDGVFRIELSKIAGTWYGYRGIISERTVVITLDEIFPVIYIQKITKSGETIYASLSNPDKSLGYTIQAIGSTLEYYFPSEP